MASLLELSTTLLIMAFLSSSVVARPLQRVVRPLGPLVGARLLEEGSMLECWNALAELSSCSGEIILFFMNGETYLGKDCCRGVRVITRHCWPSMLTSVGFTAEEGDILRGYCDAGDEAPAPEVVAP
ncbi:hypothetical protein AMTRI_Chr11g156230 [Amborella trichopoda]|uniref:Prolamin-like domain-containing protein n=1 Tax=Amborella trichopoda TaxID=13333 RepID=W1PLV8_AMBTC|nr:egg cell-secreted protein 1.4 [Amborella trichopoda]ERN08734.1 hypothetical protein AMTR_s00017p00240840 [Amborella trichopoda]|eukprot:XP_006847153.1 egg cell-secreted protein 1.4 [Amborella trichopoda]